MSPTNCARAEVARHLLSLMDADSKEKIMILAPYRGQVKLLERYIRKQRKRIIISTIDAAQGQEADLVIVSLVRANARGLVGFVDDGRRLNVSITRAKAGVIIVGHLFTTLHATTSGLPQLLNAERPQVHLQVR